MSCPDGMCLEPGKRRRALIMFGLMMLVFIVLSGFSFVNSRGQVTPDTVSFGPYQASDGKRVFQAYNCMDCHTIVGNGAYLAPDLTKEYEAAGPAWLAAFLPSAGHWPTEAALRVQLMDQEIVMETGVSTLEGYYKKYPGAKERIERRGGKPTFMPSLRFRANEVGQLIAYMKYTTEMNTEGWPPKVLTGTLEQRLELFRGRSAAAPAAAAPSEAVPTAATPAERGAQLVQTYGCLACHSPEDKVVVGPGWGGLYGSKVKLDDGKTLTADDAYIEESILQPNAKVVAGYPKGTMPSYDGLVKSDEVKDIVAYIQTLEKK